MTVVVTEGTVPPPELWREKIVCKPDDVYDTNQGCGATLEVRAGDLVLRYWKASHSNKYYTAVTCPRCGKFNRVRPPKSVWGPLHTDERKATATFDGFSDR